MTTAANSRAAAGGIDQIAAADTGDPRLGPLWEGLFNDPLLAPLFDNGRLSETLRHLADRLDAARPS